MRLPQLYATVDHHNLAPKTVINEQRQANLQQFLGRMEFGNYGNIINV